MAESDVRTTTILFTDLVNSTELMQRAGDEDAQRIFRAHYQLLRDAVSANGGAEVKSLGDGLMVEFNSAADAVRCAIVMQQSSRRSASGGRLAIRVGINTGDALRDEGDLFGTPVVIARRLCDTAKAGQILCSGVVEGLLAGRQAFAFADVGALDLKGIATPVSAREVVYEQEQPGAFLTRTPFVGRTGEMERLQVKLDEAKSGRGGLVFLVGEPGIGKSRMIEEFCERAGDGGALVLTGRCFEGEWAPPYGPFAEAIAGYAKDADASELRSDLGYGAPPIARLAPAVRDVLPDVEEPAPLQPDEERFRLLDAVSQFVISLSERAPVVLVLDDLHWADRGTIAMLRHVARFAPKHRVLILGAYRDMELDRQHPLSDALGQLRRESEYERLLLKGLQQTEVGLLLQTIAEQEVNSALVQAISDETDGNPFFIREVLIHLVDEGKLYREEGTWRSSATSIADLGIPEGVRQVITRRLSRLSEPANRLMTAASAFNGGFRFQTVATVAGLDETSALDAIDEALSAQLLRPGGVAERYDFTHALVRHTLYGEMNPSRQVRLHRQIAEAIEERVAAYPPEQGAPHAGELAYQYHRSADMPGAERGVKHALTAADLSEANAAWDESAGFLGMAIDLMLQDDVLRTSTGARRALALLTAQRFDEGTREAINTARRLAEVEGHTAAANFLQDAQATAFLAGALRVSWALADEGMRYVDDRRDRTWVELFRMSRWGRMATDPHAFGIGVPFGDPEFDEWTRIVSSLPLSQRIPMFASRDDAIAALADAGDSAAGRGPTVRAVRRGRAVLATVIGDYRRALDSYREMERETEREGRTAGRILALSMISRCHSVLGEFAAAREALAQGTELAERLAQASRQAQLLFAATDELRYATGEEVDESIALQSAIVDEDEPELRWARAGSCAALARILAGAGRADEAMKLVASLTDVIERAPIWEGNYPRIVCDAAATLWMTGRIDHIDVIEGALREKVVKPDYRYPMQDGRTALARMCALRGQYEEASRWLGEARRVTEEQSARPLRAIVDHDEALMFIRRNADGDRERALPLLDAALAQFRQIGMTGWIARADELRASIGRG
jgi:class 3 adenylate cyclase/tetratricopeptide (TPR) repeat protein